MNTEIVKTRRKFVLNTNYSVAISTKETIFDEAFKGSVRELCFWLDWDNLAAAALDDCKLIVMIDGVKVIDEYIASLYRASGKIVNNGQVIRFTEYDMTTEKRASFQIELQTLVESEVKVEIHNYDDSYSVDVGAILIYDR